MMNEKKKQRRNKQESTTEKKKQKKTEKDKMECFYRMLNAKRKSFSLQSYFFFVFMWLRWYQNNDIPLTIVIDEMNVFFLKMGKNSTRIFACQPIFLSR